VEHVQNAVMGGSQEARKVTIFGQEESVTLCVRQVAQYMKIDQKIHANLLLAHG
jgi:hypothetical protein